jgi:hypothetical protein
MNEIKSKDVEKIDVTIKTEPIFDPDKRIKPRENDATTIFEPIYDPDKRIEGRLVFTESDKQFAPDERIKSREDDITTIFEPTYDPDKRIEGRFVFAESDKAFDPNKKIQSSADSLTFSEQIEKKEVKGGAYSEVKKNSNGETHEVHHMPADATSELSHGDGPAIRMEKADHRRTASCGYSKEAQEYRAIQKQLIEEGKFHEALQMDIDDIHEKFGDKYDDAIEEMLVYVDQLEAEGRI